jgi:integrase
MSITKREGSPFYFAVFQINNRRFFRSTKTASRRDALAVEKRIREEELKRAREGDRERLTLDEAFGRFWLEVGYKHDDLKQRKDTQRYIAQILAVADKDRLVEDVTDADVNDFVQARSRANAGMIATNRAIAVWRQMHRRAGKKWKQKTQIIDWSSNLEKERKRTNYLEFEQVRTLLGTLPEYLQLAVEWSVAAGTRRAATFGMEWANVFFDRGYAVVKEKGKPEFKVWLSPQLIDILSRARIVGHPPALRQHGSVKDREAKQKDAERFVFCSRNWRKLWERGLKAAGIEDFRWHDLRHTFATWLRQEDTPLEVVQRALGHAQITTTMRYAHVADRELQAALHKVPSFSTSENNIVSIKSGKSKG